MQYLMSVIQFDDAEMGGRDRKIPRISWANQAYVVVNNKRHHLKEGKGEAETDT